MLSKRLVLHYAFLFLLVFPLTVFAQDAAPLTIDDIMGKRKSQGELLIKDLDDAMASFSISLKSVPSLLPFISNGDRTGFANKIAEMGGDPDAEAIYSQLSELVQNGLTTEVIQENLANEAFKAMDDAQIAVSDRGSLMSLMSDESESGPKSLEDKLTEMGLKGAELVKFMKVASKLSEDGLGADDFQQQIRVEAFSKAMAETSLKEDDWLKFIQAFNEGGILTEDLLELGLKDREFSNTLHSAAEELYTGFGMSEQAKKDLEQQALITNVENAGGDQQTLESIGNKFDLDQEQVNSLVEANGDPEATEAALNEMGVDTNNQNEAQPTAESNDQPVVQSDDSTNNEQVDQSSQDEEDEEDEEDTSDDNDPDSADD